MQVDVCIILNHTLNPISLIYFQVSSEPVQIVLGSAPSSMAMGPGRDSLQHHISYNPARQQQQPVSSGRHIQLQTVDTPTGSSLAY